MQHDPSLDYLIELHGQRVNREDGYWWKIEAWQVKPNNFIPHGIRYNLTVHDKHNTRVFGMDNAHAIKPPKKGKYTGRLVYDHIHRTPRDKGYPYEFTSASQCSRTSLRRWMKRSQKEKREGRRNESTDRCNV